MGGVQSIKEPEGRNKSKVGKITVREEGLAGGTLLNLALIPPNTGGKLFTKFE